MALAKCSCGGDGVVFGAGREREVAPGGIVLKPEVPETALCLACAEARGWLVAPPEPQA